MSNPLVVDGVRYISAGEAGKLVGLSRDYIARFCREGQIRARQDGRNWYVDPDSLTAYLAAREQEARERRERISAELRSVAAVRAAEAEQDAARALAARKRAQAERFAHAHAPRVSRGLSALAAALLLIATAGIMYENPSASALALSSIRALPATLAADIESATSFLDQRLANFGNTLSYTAAAAEPVSNLASAAAPLDSNSPTAQQTATSTASPAASPTPSTPTTATIVYQTINQPVAERTVVQPASDQPLATKFDSLLGIVGSLTKLVPSFASAQPDQTPQAVAAGGNPNIPFAAQSAVSQLANTNISAPAITGGSISNTSFSGGSVSASGLSVSGNTSLSGDLSVGGALNAGALTFSAASTTGIITTNATATNAVITNATTTDLYADTGNILSLSASNATSSNFFATNASTTNATSTNLFASLGNFTSAIANALSAAAADITNLTATNLVATNATTTNATSTNLYAQNAIIGQLAATDASLTSATTSLLFVKSALSSPNATFGALTATTSLAVSGTTTLAAATSTSFAITSIPWGLLSTDGAGNIVATSSPTALKFTATSATAISTFAGGLIVSGDVGIGTTSPFASLTVDPSTAATLATFGPNYNGGTPYNTGNKQVIVQSWSGTPSLLLENNGNDSALLSAPGGNFEISEGANGHVDFYATQGGDVGIGTTGALGKLTTFYDPSVQWGLVLKPANDTYNGSPILFYNSSGGAAGNISQTVSSVSYNTTSDRRLKTDIATTTTGLNALLQIPVDNFVFKSDPTHTLQQGFIAQSLYPIYPEAVTTNGDNGIVPLGPTSTPWEVDYGRITPLIVKSVQDLNAKVDQNASTMLVMVQNINSVFDAANASTTEPSILSLFQGTTTPAVTIDALGNLSIGTSTATSTTDQMLCLNGGCITSFPFATSTVSSTPSFAADFLNALEQTITQWLANASNGITDLFAKVGHFNDTYTQRLCIIDGANDNTPLCVTKAQLAALLSQSAAAALPESVSSSAPQNPSAPLPEPASSTSTESVSSATSTNATDTPPIIHINGNNPATVQVGSVYSDLGATITGPAQDLNLDIHTFVNDTPMSPVLIDTSAAATDTIAYVVTDQNGLTSTSTRTVIVQAAPNQVAAPANDNSPAATSTPNIDLPSATSSPVNDNTATSSSSTAATSTSQ